MWFRSFLIKSLYRSNFAGKYNGGSKYFDFKHQMLLDELEIDMDYDQYKYYVLLDELF